jgi:hypothetical protein
MMPNINIGCKTPHGLPLEIGVNSRNCTIGKDYQCVVLNGVNKAKPGARYGVTSVDEDLWKTWLKANAKLRYVLDGSVWAISSEPPSLVAPKVSPRATIKRR